jgi:diguanylate cyclase (GGDEF)-like protein
VPWYFVARYHVTMQRRMQELHNMSTHDSLTGLFDRRDIMEVIKKALEAHAGKTAMLLVDINNVTTINDARGHVAGDAVLARTSQAVLYAPIAAVRAP